MPGTISRATNRWAIVGLLYAKLFWLFQPDDNVNLYWEHLPAIDLPAGWHVPDKALKGLADPRQVTADKFGRDPVESFREHVWVAPFYEDDIGKIRDAIGADRILLGSDWPHPEGLSEPRAAVSDFASLGTAEQRMVLRENLKYLSGR